jgi:hypothetical protein
VLSRAEDQAAQRVRPGRCPECLHKTFQLALRLTPWRGRVLCRWKMSIEWKNRWNWWQTGFVKMAGPLDQAYVCAHCGWWCTALITHDPAYPKMDATSSLGDDTLGHAWDKMVAIRRERYADE